MNGGGEIHLKVGYTDGTEVGGSGRPMREGWWWQSTVDGHRARAWAPSERAAWREGLLNLFDRCGVTA